MSPALTESVRRRLVELVRGPWSDRTVTDSDCWDFSGRWRSRFGYGRLRAAGHNGRQLQAHVAMYLLERGAYPVGMVLDHRCRRPICCNPAHLEPVSVAENNRRRWRPEPTYDAGAVEAYAELCELEEETCSSIGSASPLIPPSFQAAGTVPAGAGAVS